MSYDVVAVDMETHEVKLMAVDISLKNADAVEGMAVLRRGVDTHFFSTVPSGKYKDGDEWIGE